MPISFLTLDGATLADTCFTLDARITGEEITWNVSRLMRDATAGLFGLPVKIPMAAIPPQTDADRANIDWAKIDVFKTTMQAVLNQPVIGIGSDHDSILCFVDGSHRLTARQQMGCKFFLTYIVPHHLEKDYRVIMSLTMR